MSRSVPGYRHEINFPASPIICLLIILTVIMYRVKGEQTMTTATKHTKRCQRIINFGLCYDATCPRCQELVKDAMMQSHGAPARAAEKKA